MLEGDFKNDTYGYGTRHNWKKFTLIIFTFLIYIVTVIFNSFQSLLIPSMYQYGSVFGPMVNNIFIKKRLLLKSHIRLFNFQCKCFVSD
jgi:hypothetical protein